MPVKKSPLLEPIARWSRRLEDDPLSMTAEDFVRAARETFDPSAPQLHQKLIDLLDKAISSDPFRGDGPMTPQWQDVLDEIEDVAIEEAWFHTACMLIVMKCWGPDRFVKSFEGRRVLINASLKNNKAIKDVEIDPERGRRPDPAQKKTFAFCSQDVRNTARQKLSDANPFFPTRPFPIDSMAAVVALWAPKRRACASLSRLHGVYYKTDETTTRALWLLAAPSHVWEQWVKQNEENASFDAAPPYLLPEYLSQITTFVSASTSQPPSSATQVHCEPKTNGALLDLMATRAAGLCDRWFYGCLLGKDRQQLNKRAKALGWVDGAVSAQTQRDGWWMPPALKHDLVITSFASRFLDFTYTAIPEEDERFAHSASFARSAERKRVLRDRIKKGCSLDMSVPDFDKYFSYSRILSPLLEEAFVRLEQGDYLAPSWWTRHANRLVDNLLSKGSGVDGNPFTATDGEITDGEIKYLFNRTLAPIQENRYMLRHLLNACMATQSPAWRLSRTHDIAKNVVDLISAGRDPDSGAFRTDFVLSGESIFVTWARRIQEDASQCGLTSCFDKWIPEDVLESDATKNLPPNGFPTRAEKQRKAFLVGIDSLLLRLKSFQRECVEILEARRKIEGKEGPLDPSGSRADADTDEKVNRKTNGKANQEMVTKEEMVARDSLDEGVAVPASKKANESSDEKSVNSEAPARPKRRIRSM